MITHQHPITLISKSLILSVVAGSALLWAMTHPAAISAMLHLNADTPGLWVIDALYGPLKLYVIATAIGMPLIAFFASWGWWSFSSYAIENRSLVYQFGPFERDVIPASKIQRVIYKCDALGALLGYGTLIVNSGAAREQFPFVPNVREFAATLEPGQ